MYDFDCPHCEYEHNIEDCLHEDYLNKPGEFEYKCKCCEKQIIIVAEPVISYSAKSEKLDAEKELMGNLTQQVQWHGIDETPIANRFYLVCLNGHTFFFTLSWDGEVWKHNDRTVFESVADITHWMPLPKSVISDEADVEG